MNEAKNLPFQHSLSLLLTCKILYKVIQHCLWFAHNVSHLLFKNWTISWFAWNCESIVMLKGVYAAVIVDLLETTHYPNHIFMRIRIIQKIQWKKIMRINKYQHFLRRMTFFFVKTSSFILHIKCTQTLHQKPVLSPFSSISSHKITFFSSSSYDAPD